MLGILKAFILFFSLFFAFLSFGVDDSNYAIDCSSPLRAADGKACGFWGCVPNPNGSGTFCTKYPKDFNKDRPQVKTGLTVVSANSFYEKIEDIAKNNSALLAILKDSKIDCCGESKAKCQRLIEKYGFSVHLLEFTDGSSQYFSPFEVKPAIVEDRDAKEVQLFTGDFMNSLQPTKLNRKLYLSKGQLKYVGTDGTIFAVKSIKKVDNSDEPFRMKYKEDCGCSLQKNQFTDVAPHVKSSSGSAQVGQGTN